MKTSAIIPAHNEEATISKIVQTILVHVDEVIVVDSCSTDRTVKLAELAGAKVVSTEKPGKHIALYKGVSLAKDNLIAFMDGDIQNPSPGFVTKPLKRLYENNMASIVKGYYTRPFHNSPNGGGRLTELCSRPLLALFFPRIIIRTTAFVR